MMKVLKSKKGLMSAAAILIALAVISGATFAWFTGNAGNSNGGTVVGLLRVTSDGLDEFNNAINDPDGLPPQAGDDFFSGDASIQNIGNLPALVKLVSDGTVQIRSDADGWWLDPTNYHDAQDVPATADKVLFGYQFGTKEFTIDGVPMDLPVVMTQDFWLATGWDSSSMTTEQIDFLLSIPSLWYDAAHISQADGTTAIKDAYYIMIPEGVTVEGLSPILDMKTNRKTIGNEFMNALITANFTLPYTQATYSEAAFDLWGASVDDPTAGTDMQLDLELAAKPGFSAARSSVHVPTYAEYMNMLYGN